MAGTTLAQILSGRVLSGAIQKVTPGLPNSLPPSLINPTGSMLRQVLGDSATFLTYRGTRRGVQRSERDAPSRNRPALGIGEQSIKLINFKNNLGIKADTLLSIKSDDSMTSSVGKQEVGRQVQDCRQYLENGRVQAVTSALSLGTINYDSDGNIMTTTSSAALSVDLGVPAANKSQIARGASSANLITESWANSSAKVLTHVQNIHSAALRVSGQRLKHAMYGSGVLQNLLASDQVNDLIAANPAYQTAFSQFQIPAGFMGLTWWPAHEMFWEDDTGTNQQTFGANNITFIPEPSSEWYELTQGTTPVPTDLNVANDAEALLANVTNAPGMHSYATMQTDPVRATMVYGDCYLPWFTCPEAVFIATTVF
jgi:hypothetical protein